MTKKEDTYPTKPLLSKQKAIQYFAKGISQQLDNKYNINAIISTISYDFIKQLHKEIADGISGNNKDRQKKESLHLFELGIEFKANIEKIKGEQKKYDNNLGAYTQDVNKISPTDISIVKEVFKWAQSCKYIPEEQKETIAIDDVKIVIQYLQEAIKQISYKPRLDLLEKCPTLGLWTTDKNTMEKQGIIHRITTKGKNGRKGNRQENAKEFLDRALYEAGITEYPYLHEVREANPALGLALDRFATRNQVDIRDIVPVAEFTAIRKSRAIRGI